jgi:hypothetical protein
VIYQSYVTLPEGKVFLIVFWAPSSMSSSTHSGGIGDCWLVAAISGMAEFPNYLRDEIFQTKEIPAQWLQ